MLFAIFCIDRPDKESLRSTLLEDHIAHFRQAGEAARAAGPLFDDDGARQCGSMIIYNADNPTDARAFIDSDPYTRGGLFEQITVRRWNWMSGADKPEG